MQWKIPLKTIFTSKKQKQILPALFVLGVILDQWSKLWAESRFLNADGAPNFEKIEVMGEYFRFSLAYNYGSAFSMKPQALVPFLSPTLFYVLISIIATYGLLKFISDLPLKDWISRTGVTLILSGALGNIADRFRIGKVVDFIDWDFPDISIFSYSLTRWPTFNLADSWVLIGISFIILAPYILKETYANAESASSKKEEVK
jgi:signal peptidase II